MLIFEETVSTLYYSNDGRLQVTRAPHPEDIHEDGRPMAAPRYVFTINCYDGLRSEGSTPVFHTYDSVKVDAYIAGYDLATQAAQ